MHYGLHYGSQTRDAGPARTRFTLRFELKNHAIKNLSVFKKTVLLFEKHWIIGTFCTGELIS